MKPKYPIKLFVDRVSMETSEDTLTEHFSKYGKVVESLIPKNFITGHPRRFGFVTFTDLSMPHKVLEDQHIILGKEVEVKTAKPKGNRDRQEWNNGSCMHSNNGNANNRINTKKVFVGGLPPITEEEFKNYFESFGTITDAVVMYDKITNKPRGFGFITFDSMEAVDNVLKESFRLLKGKLVEVKRAEPKGRNIYNQINYYNSYYNTWLPYGYNDMYQSYASWYDTYPYHCYYGPYYGWHAAPYGVSEFSCVVSQSNLDGFVHNQGLMPLGSLGFYPPLISDTNYVSDSVGRAMNKIDGGDGRTTVKSILNGNLNNNNGSGGDVKVEDVTNSLQIDDSSCKSNRNTDSGDLKLPVTANSPQIDNSSSGQEHQHGAGGQSKFPYSDSLFIPNGSLEQSGQ